MRRTARASRHRPASRRSSPAPSSFRVTATVMAPSADRLHRRSTPSGRAWRHGPNGQKLGPLVLGSAATGAAVGGSGGDLAGRVAGGVDGTVAAMGGALAGAALATAADSYV